MINKIISRYEKRLIKCGISEEKPKEIKLEMKISVIQPKISR